MYTKAALNVDTIAERILALGERPFSTYREFLKNSDFDETSNHLNAKRMVKAIIEDLDGLISQENKYHEVAEGDEATLNLLDNLIDTQEQDRWMLKAFLDE